MAYKRGRGAGISRARRMKARRKEQAELQAQLNAIEVAKQNEARERQRSQMSGLGVGTLIGLLTGAGVPALAMWMAGGKAAGDINYAAFGGDDKDEIQEALDDLENFDTTSMDLKQSAEQNLYAGEMAKEDIMGGDFTTGLTTFGTDFLTYYMTLAGLDKAGGANTNVFGEDGSIGQIFDIT
tara:strand:- start:4646 stop:5191 length:546 start_codon:yes stop_codon:yes gene_type:complete